MLRKSKGKEKPIYCDPTYVPDNKKLSIQQCRRILEANSSRKYTDEEIYQIRDQLYNFAKIEHQIHISNTIKTSNLPGKTGEQLKLF